MEQLALNGPESFCPLKFIMVRYYIDCRVINLNCHIIYSIRSININILINSINTTLKYIRFIVLEKLNGYCMMLRARGIS